ncbi:MAG: biotin transporter BioY [Dehalococcoidia bacterium]|nr:biotin transporter BioY [Dehalococcoidia bacterium]MYD50529.1 biotin transporter BioY [Dehalococcoidia bacterium]
MQQAKGPTALVDQLIPRSDTALTNAVIDAVLIVGFAALTGLSAKVAVYLNPAVPITGQTFAVLLSGAVLGSKRGAASMLVYLGMGIAGVPVFAPDGAIPHASRGYLIGFAVAAFIVGWLVERGWGRNPLKLALAMLLGEVAIYGFGMPWLAFYIPESELVERSRLAVVYDWGLEDFIIGDTIKLIMAAVGVPLAWEAIRRLKGEEQPE